MEVGGEQGRGRRTRLATAFAAVLIAAVAPAGCGGDGQSDLPAVGGLSYPAAFKAVRDAGYAAYPDGENSGGPRLEDMTACYAAVLSDSQAIIRVARGPHACIGVDNANGGS